MATATNINGWNVGGNNNSFDQRGHFYRGVFSGNVSGMLVKQNSTPNMTVVVEHGSALLNKNSISASVAEIKSDTSVTIDTANTSNPRIDSIVIYEDTSIAIPAVEADYWQDGAGGRFKVVSLPGTAAASPVALSDANIQSAIGAGKPWTRLADITVPANSTTILNSNIADRRAQLGGAYMPADKIDFATFDPKNIGIGDYHKLMNFSYGEFDMGWSMTCRCIRIATFCIWRIDSTSNLQARDFAEKVPEKWRPQYTATLSLSPFLNSQNAFAGGIYRFYPNGDIKYDGTLGHYERYGNGIYELANPFID